MVSSNETPSLSKVTHASAAASAVTASSNDRTRVNTLAGLANPYGLPLPEEQLQRLTRTLAPSTLHRLLGFLCGALTIPEPVPPSEWAASIDHANKAIFDGDEDFDGDLKDAAKKKSSSAAACNEQLVVVAEHVRRQIETGEIAPIIPVAEDTAACRDWVRGFQAAECNALHDLSDEEGELSAKLRAMARSREPERPRFDSLHDDVAKLIAIWRLVPPYDPATDPEATELRPEPQPAPPSLPAIPSVSTPYQRTTPKVGRNDLCPCGSGKKYKKCCA